jgi:hypothetical protein
VRTRNTGATADTATAQDDSSSASEALTPGVPFVCAVCGVSPPEVRVVRDLLCCAVLSPRSSSYADATRTRLQARVLLYMRTLTGTQPRYCQPVGRRSDGGEAVSPVLPAGAHVCTGGRLCAIVINITHHVKLCFCTKL